MTYVPQRADSGIRTLPASLLEGLPSASGMAIIAAVESGERMGGMGWYEETVDLLETELRGVAGTFTGLSAEE